MIKNPTKILNFSVQKREPLQSGLDADACVADIDANIEPGINYCETWGELKSNIYDWIGQMEGAAHGKK